MSQSVLIQKTLQQLGIQELNPMQEAFIAQFQAHEELELIAPTGSGKTLAFLLPMIEMLQTDLKAIQTLVITPTRELAIQIEDVFKKMGTSFKVNSTYGGHSMRIERNNFTEPPIVLIGTPGRLVDHFNRGTIDCSFVHTLILDEFDKSLEMGFQDDMKIIIQKLHRLKKKVLVSATEIESIPAFTKIKTPVKINFSSSIESKLNYFKIKAKDTEKVEVLFDVLCSLPTEPTIVFCNHRDAVERISGILEENGIQTVFYHGGLEQDERERALIRFRNGSAYYLITTDLAARGLDIPEVEHVIHYQLPNQEAVYTHRNGRTARQASTGNAFVIVSDTERLPDFMQEDFTDFVFKKDSQLPNQPDWKTIYIGGGKKDKINKIDVVGFLSKIGGLQQPEIGLISVLDHSVLVAISARKAEQTVAKIRTEKIKGKKVKIGFAR